MGTKHIVSLPGDASKYLNGLGQWSVPTAGSAHNILSSSHGDSVAASVVRGDIITGQGASPLWKRLAASVPGSGLRNLLGFDNGDTEPSWKSILDNTNPANFGSASPGSSLLAARRDHVHPGQDIQTSASPTFSGFTSVSRKVWYVVTDEAVSFSGSQTLGGSYALECRFYRILFAGNINHNADAVLRIQNTSDTTSHYCTVRHWGGTAHDHSGTNWNLDGFGLTENVWSQSTNVIADAIIFSTAVNSKHTLFNGTSFAIRNDEGAWYTYTRGGFAAYNGSIGGLKLIHPGTVTGRIVVLALR